MNIDGDSYATYTNNCSSFFLSAFFKCLGTSACGGTVVQWLSRCTFNVKLGGWRPGLCHHVVSLDKKHYSALSLS